jgi:aminobenzoyl-glutamate utilization protein B
MKTPRNPPKLRSLSQRPAIIAALKHLAGQGCDVAQRIAEFAEPGLAEFKSSALLAEFLAANGFRVTRPWKDMPTAFKAVARTGGKGGRAHGPAIAFLAEYDALPDCGAAQGQWGHGCGHNLLGVGAVLAGIAAARTLQRSGTDATIIVFGCPAEETLAGKVYMAHNGAFADLDAVLAWHPYPRTLVYAAGGAAVDSMLFQFRGRTAHAGRAHLGRSALDAAMLTDVAVNYLREHVEPNIRMHGIITKGGNAPNVVPDLAESWYYIRGRDRAQVDDLRRRVLLCARGAAMATETTFRMTMKTCVAERIGNKTLSGMLQAILDRCGPPKFTPADIRAAAKALPGKKYSTRIDPMIVTPDPVSSDEDNVSWFAPLSCLRMACVLEGVASHHRDYEKLCRISGAHRGMLKAAEVLATGAVELATNRPLRQQAMAEFRKNMRGKKYRLPISAQAMRRLGKGQ